MCLLLTNVIRFRDLDVERKVSTFEKSVERSRSDTLKSTPGSVRIFNLLTGFFLLRTITN
jgi:hypothetical protein